MGNADTDDLVWSLDDASSMNLWSLPV